MEISTNREEVKAMANTVKPGAATPVSGQYVEVGPRGGIHGNTEITSVYGKTMPPTSRPNSSWMLVDPTKHAK